MKEHSVSSLHVGTFDAEARHQARVYILTFRIVPQRLVLEFDKSSKTKMNPLSRRQPIAVWKVSNSPNLLSVRASVSWEVERTLLWNVVQ
jgi:hypothetical protein